MNPSNECEECGKAFADSARLFTHQRKSCRPGKRSWEELLSDARDLWKSKESGPRKRLRLDEIEAPPPPPSRDKQKRRLKEKSTGVRASKVQGGPSLVGVSVRVSTLVHDGELMLQLLQSSDVTMSLVSDPRLPAVNPPSNTPGDTLMQVDPPTIPHSPRSTKRDSFGLFKYFDEALLSHHPETPIDISATLPPPLSPASPAREIPPASDQNSLPPCTPTTQFHPYPNWSSFELGDLLWNRGPINSQDHFRALVGLLKNPDFSLDEIRQTNWDKVHKRLAEGKQPGLDLNTDWVDNIGPGWSATRIFLRVPFPKTTKDKEPSTTVFYAGLLHHRKLVSVIKEKIADPREHRHRHFQAHQVLWQPESFAQPVRVYGEVYSSDEFRRMEAEVQQITLDVEEDRKLERVVLALMFWTDTTLLANFGTAKLWPCYLFFGNDPKSLRGKPSANLCNHIAYFESVRHSIIAYSQKV
jgi:Plavaka transposase